MNDRNIEFDKPIHNYGYKIIPSNTKSLEGFKFPSSLKTFECEDNKIETIRNIIFPETLERFTCSRNNLTSLEGVTLSRNLKMFDVSFNSITSIKGLVIPPKMEMFLIYVNNIRSLDDVIFPSTLGEYNEFNIKLIMFEANLLQEEYFNKDGKVRSIKELNEMAYTFRFREGIKIINKIVTDKMIREIQKLWKNYWYTPMTLDGYDYWYTPMTLDGYDYLVSRYMIHHRDSLIT